MGASEDEWVNERDQGPTWLDLDARDQIRDMLDRAAAAARAYRLNEAARHLEVAHHLLVTHQTFSRWDNGIWWFAALIRMIRAMSAESAVPPEFQRFLDAIPSAAIDQDMTRPQLVFWYGGEHNRVKEFDIQRRRTNEKRADRGQVIVSGVVCLIILLVILYFSYG